MNRLLIARQEQEARDLRKREVEALEAQAKSLKQLTVQLAITNACLGLLFNNSTQMYGTQDERGNLWAKTVDQLVGG